MASRGQPRPRAATGLWWLSPAGAAACVLVPTLMLAVSTSDERFRRNWGTPKALGGSSLQLIALGILVFVIGAVIPSAARRPLPLREWPALDLYDRVLLRRAATVLYRLTIVGYVLYLLSGVKNGLRPVDLWNVFITQNNDTNELKRTFVPIPGVTTLTQVGIAFAVVGTLLLVEGRHALTERRLIVIASLALFRAYFVTERLAVIELIVPLGSIAALRLVHTARRRGAILLRVAPILIVPVLLVGFGLFEYSRSWAFYSRNAPQSFTSFTVNRVTGYYTTAYNNGAIQLQHGGYFGRIPYGTLEGVWTGPLFDQAHVYERVSGQDEPRLYRELIEEHGNLEFNSPSGVTMPFVDFGAAGGMLYLFGAGLLAGFMYTEFCRAKLWAMLTYPVIMTGLLELPRYLYWAQGRALVAFVSLFLTLRYLRHGRLMGGSGRLAGHGAL